MSTLQLQLQLMGREHRLQSLENDRAQGRAVEARVLNFEADKLTKVNVLAEGQARAGAAVLSCQRYRGAASMI